MALDRSVITFPTAQGAPLEEAALEEIVVAATFAACDRFGLERFARSMTYACEQADSEIKMAA